MTRSSEPLSDAGTQRLGFAILPPRSASGSSASKRGAPGNTISRGTPPMQTVVTGAELPQSSHASQVVADDHTYRAVSDPFVATPTLHLAGPEKF